MLLTQVRSETQSSATLGAKEEDVKFGESRRPAVEAVEDTLWKKHQEEPCKTKFSDHCYTEYDVQPKLPLNLDSTESSRSVNSEYKRVMMLSLITCGFVTPGSEDNVSDVTEGNQVDHEPQQIVSPDCIPTHTYPSREPTVSQSNDSICITAESGDGIITIIYCVNVASFQGSSQSFHSSISNFHVMQCMHASGRQ